MRREPVRHRAARGFTIVELIVASVVVATALAGIYAIVRQVTSAEAVASTRWRERAAARAVADHLAGALEHAVNLPDLETRLGTNSSPYLVCTVATPTGLERRRYGWSADVAGAGNLTLQVMPYAGTANVSVARFDGVSGDGAWRDVPRTIIARNVDLSVATRAAGGSVADWSARWGGRVGGRLFRVRVTMQESDFERMVLSRCDADLVEARTP